MQVATEQRSELSTTGGNRLVECCLELLQVGRSLPADRLDDDRGSLLADARQIPERSVAHPLG